MTRVGLLVVFAALLSVAPSGAHPLTFTATELVIQRDGRFVAEMICDLDALALGVPQDSDDAELVATLRALSADELDQRIERLERLFERRVRVRFDGQPAPVDVSFPDHGTPRADEAEIPTLLGLTARLSGAVPPGATTVEFFASRSFSDVHLTVVDERRGVIGRTVLERGARSDPFDLAGPPEPVGRGEITWQYLRLGFRHIVPDGLDHVLFVLGLFLLSARLKPLVWQVTAFTIAHAITLTLAALGAIDLPAQIVEALIAVSIVYVAVENLLTTRMMPWRPMVVFLFGLLHGVGFAGALRELGLPGQDRLLGLAAFNVGIELGQLAVIGAAFLTVGWWRHQPWYRSRIVIPASVAIALVGAGWAMERLLSA